MVAARRMIRFVAGLFTWIAGVSLLIAYLSVFIPPDRFWLPAFFGLAFPYLVAGVFLLMLFWWMQHAWRKGLVLFLLLVLGWGHMRHFYSLPRRPAPRPSGGITVMTFNVRSFDIFSDHDRRHPEEGIVSFLRKVQPDVLCLQEIYTSPRTVPEERVLTALGYPYHFITYTKVRENGSRYGIALFSRYPILHRQVIRYAGSSNCSQSCDILAGGDTLRFFNNHLQSTHLGGKEFRFAALPEDKEALQDVRRISMRLRTAYALRARQVRILRDSIDASPFPVVVCGDFNDTPVSYTYRHLSRGLTDAFVESGKGFGKTYHGKVPSFRIDYILHDPSWRSADYRTFHNDLSDHFAVMCTLYRDRGSLPRE